MNHQTILIFMILCSVLPIYLYIWHFNTAGVVLLAKLKPIFFKQCKIYFFLLFFFFVKESKYDEAVVVLRGAGGCGGGDQLLNWSHGVGIVKNGKGSIILYQWKFGFWDLGFQII